MFTGTFLKAFSVQKNIQEEFLRANLPSIFCTYIMSLPLTSLIAGFYFYCWSCML